MSGEHGLEEAAGYQVETSDGRIGNVVAVLPRSANNNTGALLLQTDSLSCKLTAVPFGDVESVDTGARRVVLRLAD